MSSLPTTPLYSPYTFSSITKAWTSTEPPPPAQLQPLPSANPLHLITWNIDFSTPRASLRLLKALDDLSTLSPPPSILLLQEICTTNLPTLLQHPWVRSSYLVSDTSPPGRYFTLTLLAHSLAASIVGLRRVDFESPMGRDVLLADIAVAGGVLRVGNTHLESLPEGQRRRGKQLGVIGELLREEGVKAGLVAGDMNIIMKKDEEILGKAGLRDAWVDAKPEEMEGGEKGEWDGHTWGYQPKSRFPPGRLDRIGVCGDVEVRIMGRVGVGLRYDEKEVLDRPKGSNDEEEEDYKHSFVSDHFGLKAEVTVGVENQRE